MVDGAERFVIWPLERHLLIAPVALSTVALKKPLANFSPKLLIDITSKVHAVNSVSVPYSGFGSGWFQNGTMPRPFGKYFRPILSEN